MSTAAAIVNLGAELVVFIAAASLLLVVTARPDFVGAEGPARMLLQIASVLTAAAAVVQGAAVDLDPGAGGLTVGRSVAYGFLLLGALGLTHRGARRLLLVGVLLFVASEFAYHRAGDSAGDVLRGLGGLATAVTAALGARQSIATRIATAATTVLLVIVVALSASLSVVITGNISREARGRVESRAQVEAGIAAQQANLAASQSGLMARILVQSGVGDAIRGDSFQRLQDAFAELITDYGLVDMLGFVDVSGSARIGVGLAQSEFVELTGSDVVQDALAGTDAASVGIVGGDLVALGATPVSVPDVRGAPQLVGVAVTGIRIDSAFLGERLQREAGTTLTVITASSVLAGTADEPPDDLAGVVGAEMAGRVTRDVLGSGSGVAAETTVAGADAFVGVEPVVASDGRTVAAFAVVIDGNLVVDTLVSLFRTLFLVALGAAAVAFLFATFGGARVTAPLRALTTAAERIAAGDLHARADIETDDEIGTLGDSFDTMTESIERMTREIREAAAQTAAILSGMAEGLVATDPDGVVVALNPAAEKLLGTKEARALARPVDAVIKGTDMSGRSLAEGLAEPLKKAWTVTGRLARRSGPLAIAMSGAPIRDEGGAIVGRVYVMRDIQREAELEAMKSEFLANISHELRTPLTPIKGYTEMMLTKNVPKSRQQAFLGTILDGAERLERYVDMLVNFSAMEAGRFELQTEVLDVAALVTRVGERWRSRAEGHAVDIEVSGRLPSVVADDRLLERAVNELVDNAVKYSPDGGSIRLEARGRGTGVSRRVEIVVADEGIGIEAADLDRIFTDFSQLDGSSTRRYGGLGLGLSFVHRVIRAHQGTLEANSEPGTGSTFTIALPPSGAESRRKAPPRRAKRSGAGARSKGAKKGDSAPKGRGRR